MKVIMLRMTLSEKSTSAASTAHTRVPWLGSVWPKSGRISETIRRDRIGSRIFQRRLLS